MKKNILLFCFFCFVLILVPNKVWASDKLLNIYLSEGTAIIDGDKLDYDVTITENDTFKVMSVVVDNATIEYSPSQEINIGYGETKTISITVTDNVTSSKKVYKINAYKVDNRATVNTLKELTVSNTEIKFNGSTSYSSTVKNEIKEVEIKATPTEAKVSLSGTGKKELKEGLNTFDVVVTSQYNKIKTYKINITREKSEKQEETTTSLSGNNYLKALTIDEIKDFKFNKNISSYNLSVSNDIEEITLNYGTEDSKASATIQGNSKLSEGQNKINIIVTAENKEVKNYSLIITRDKKEEEIDNETQKILDALDGDDKIITIKAKLNSKNTDVNKKIIDKLKEKEKILVYEVNNSSGGLLYSATFTGNKITDKITKLDYGLSFTANANDKTKLDRLIKDYSVLYLNFTHSGVLPKDTTYKIYVGNRYDDGSLVYLYHYNEDKNKLEYVEKKIESINGYITIKIDHSSLYILSNQKIEASNNVITVILIITFLVLIIFGLVYAIIRKKKKNNIGLEEQNDINVFNPLVDNNETKENNKEEEIEIVDMD